MNKLTPEQITAAYNKVSGRDLTVDSPEVDQATLRAIIAKAWNKVEDGLKYEHLNMSTKAAVQCLELARRRPFPDHNIKTAILSTLTMLELNGIYIRLDAESAEQMKKRLTHPTTTYADFAEWLRSHVSKPGE